MGEISIPLSGKVRVRVRSKVFLLPRVAPVATIIQSLRDCSGFLHSLRVYFVVAGMTDKK
jgi:hypothetical protein